MHEETYPVFFTPRDEDPSLSSSEEKSSEFDWLKIKRMRKQKYIEKQSALYFTSLQNCTNDASPRTSSPYFTYDFIEDYKLYIRGYSPFF